MAKITIVAYDRCMYSSIAGLRDAFSISNLWHELFERKRKSDDLPIAPLFEMETVTWQGKPFKTSCGMRIIPDRAMEEVKNTDLILITPHLLKDQPLPEEIPDLLQWVINQNQNNIRIGAICTGTLILAMTGLLDGKIATTNWQVIKKFKRLFPKVILKSERILTEDSGLICSGAVTAQYNLALYIIEAFGSKDLARICAKTFLVDPGQNTQTPYIITNFRKNHGDQKILKAQHWLEEHYSDNVIIDEVARIVGLGPRHFKRRFKKATDENPLAYLQQIRLEAAKLSLETTTDNIDEITQQIGYEDSSTFRRLFKKFTSLSPRAYRDKFSIC